MGIKRTWGARVIADPIRGGFSPTVNSGLRGSLTSTRNTYASRMSPATHRAVELLIGFALVGYGAYAIYTGKVLGKFRSYSRDENPWSFWTGVLVTLGVGIAFLFGAVSWHK
jgi:hypothetical protein